MSDSVGLSEEQVLEAAERIGMAILVSIEELKDDGILPEKVRVLAVASVLGAALLFVHTSVARLVDRANQQKEKDGSK